MLKTIASLQGVNILSKAAQKKVGGGRLQACGVIVTYPGSTTKYVLFTPDENGNGATKDEAMYTAANSNTISNNNGGYFQPEFVKFVRHKHNCTPIVL